MLVLSPLVSDCEAQVQEVAPLVLTVVSEAIPTLTAGPASAQTNERLTLIIAYDNNAHNPDLQTAWGFACLVETGGALILFDTGGDGSILLRNMAEPDIDPQAIDIVVLSYAHNDHTGGLSRLLDTGAKPTVYVPAQSSSR